MWRALSAEPTASHSECCSGPRRLGRWFWLERRVRHSRQGWLQRQHRPRAGNFVYRRSENYLFTYDGKQYGPRLNVEKAIVVYTRGSRFLEGTPIPPSRFDHQATYLDFWLRLVGVRDLRSVVVDNAWNRDRRESEVSLAKGKASLERLVEWFLASSELQQRAMPLT